MRGDSVGCGVRHCQKTGTPNAAPSPHPAKVLWPSDPGRPLEGAQMTPGRLQSHSLSQPWERCLIMLRVIIQAPFNYHDTNDYYCVYTTFTTAAAARGRSRSRLSSLAFRVAVTRKQL